MNRKVLIGKILHLSVIAALVLFTWLELLLIVYRFPDNHGRGIREGLYLLAFSSVLHVADCMVRKRWRWRETLLIVLLLVALLFCEKFNIIVDYETWNERLQPEWGELVLPAEIKRRKREARWERERWELIWEREAMLKEKDPDDSVYGKENEEGEPIE